MSVLAPCSEVHSSFYNPWRIFGDDGKNETITKGSEKKEEKTNKNTRKRTDWESQEERREIQPRWPGVYEMEEDSVGSCAAL